MWQRTPPFCKGARAMIGRLLPKGGRRGKSYGKEARGRHVEAWRQNVPFALHPRLGQVFARTHPRRRGECGRGDGDARRAAHEYARRTEHPRLHSRACDAPAEHVGRTHGRGSRAHRPHGARAWLRRLHQGGDHARCEVSSAGQRGDGSRDEITCRLGFSRPAVHVSRPLCGACP